MTELEKQLLSALEQLQQDYSRRLTSGRALRGMAEDVWSYATENAALSERVSGLSRQVQSLSEQLRRLSTG
jgi:polyhydroxyalkanoate synthesis regulator phasin